jgi:predicted Zn-dependent peptidase
LSPNAGLAHLVGEPSPSAFVPARLECGIVRSSFVEHYLPNGLRVVCEAMPRVRSAALGFFVRAGSRHERSHQHGVSHFLEHMCFKGTPTRSWREINVRFDELGSIYNAFTSKEHTVYFGWVPAGRVEAQLELLADMMRPSLTPADFDTERKVILEEIAMSGDSFEHQVWNFLHDVCFASHPLAHDILGEQGAIEGMSRDVMVDYHRHRYAPENVTLVAAGAVEPEEVFAAVGRYCGEWERATDRSVGFSAPSLRLNGVRGCKLGQFKQQSIILVYPSVPSGHHDAETIEVFQSLFGGANSRCYWNIVQKGICSQAGAAWLSYDDCGMLALYADGEPERCGEMLAALKEQARDVRESGFRPEEVQRVKNRRRTHLALEAESPRTRLMQLGDDLETRGHVRSTDARLAAVEAVSEKTIASYLQRFPITGDGLLLSCGPRDFAG